MSYKKMKSVGILLLLLLFLQGCIAMMPLMMGAPYLVKKFREKPVDPVLEDAITKLLDESVNEIHSFSATYDQLIVEAVDVISLSYPTARFRTALLNKLKSRKDWTVTDRQKDTAIISPISESSRSEFPTHSANLNGQLYAAGGRLHLALQLSEGKTATLIESIVRSIQFPVSVQRGI